MLKFAFRPQIALRTTNVTNRSSLVQKPSSRLFGDSYQQEKQNRIYDADGASDPRVEGNAMIRAAARDRDWRQMFKTFEDMKEKGLKPSASAYGAILNFHGRKNIPKMMATFNEMKTVGIRPNVITFNILLTALAGSKQTEATERISAAKQLWQEMKDVSIEPNEATYSRMMTLLSKAQAYEDMYDLYEQFKSTGKSPTSQIINCLMSSAVKQEKYSEVPILKQQLKDLGLPIDHYTYNILIHAAGKQQKFDEMHAVFQEMKDAGLPVDSVTYLTMINSYLVSGLQDKALETAEIMKAEGIELPPYLNTKLYGTVEGTPAEN